MPRAHSTNQRRVRSRISRGKCPNPSFRRWYQNAVRSSPTSAPARATLPPARSRADRTTSSSVWRSPPISRSWLGVRSNPDPAPLRSRHGSPPRARPAASWRRRAQTGIAAAPPRRTGRARIACLMSSATSSPAASGSVATTMQRNRASFMAMRWSKLLPLSPARTALPGPITPLDRQPVGIAPSNTRTVLPGPRVLAPKNARVRTLSLARAEVPDLVVERTCGPCSWPTAPGRRTPGTQSSPRASRRARNQSSNVQPARP